MSGIVEYRRQTTISKATTSYDADVTTYISGLTPQPSAGYLTILNTFVVGLKSDFTITNLSDFFDVMYLFDNDLETASLRNLVKRSHDATNVSSTSWSQYNGYTGDAIADYINTNYNAATQAVNFTLDDASIGFYNKLDISLTARVWQSTGGNITIDIGANHHETYPGIYVRLNSSESSYRNDASFTNASGMTISTRNGSTDGALVAYRDKASATLSSSGSNATVAIPNNNIYILAANDEGTATGFCDTQVSFFFIGKYMTTARRDFLCDRYTTYRGSL